MNQQQIYISLDIGSSYIKVLIGEISNGRLNVIGVGNVKSTGVRKGAIVDIDATVQSIKKAVDQAERMTGIQIKQVILGVPANQLNLQPVKGVVAVNSPNREVSDDDLDRVLESARVLSIPPEREVINVIRKQFQVDNLDGIQDPRGMIGVRLEMDGTMLTTSRTLLHNVLRCVERAGLEVTEIYLQSLAAGYYALTEDEKNQGTAYIDLGGGSTTIAIFENGLLTNASVIPVGGDHITNDLSIVLKTPTEQAEKIKRQYGHAFYDDASDEQLFEVPVVGTDTTDQYSQRYISEIIGVRLEELFELILDEIARYGLKDLPGGIVLTGGVAQLEGIAPLARKVMMTRVRIHTPDYIGVRDPAYTTAVGLIQYAYNEDKFFSSSSVQSSANTGHPIVQPMPQIAVEETRSDVISNTESAHEKDSKPKMVDRAKKFISSFFE